MTTFAELGLSDAVLAAVDHLGYTEPTPVQAQAIPLVLQGRDIIAAAKTGTGKTAAFSLPSLDVLARAERKKAPAMLVITPTRELAMQIQEVCQTIARTRGLRVANVVGGVKIEPQIDRLARGVDVLIATPGRLIDLMNQKAVDLSQVQVLVLDEADRMLDMGFLPSVRRIVEDFDALPLAGEGTKPRVGVVGEILVKFHPTANNQIVDVIEREGCEAVVPGLIEFFLFGIAGGIFQQPIGKSKKSALGSKIGLAAIKKLRKPVNDALEKSSRFHPPADIYELADYASEILSLCNSMGEGWLLTAEMVELIRSGCPNVVCTQPFACLPNHVVGKATIKELRRRYPESNIVAVDYDPGASEVNQLNRIKLMIAVAKANLAEKEAEARAARAVARDGAPEEPETVAASVEVETTEVVG